MEAKRTEEAPEIETEAIEPIVHSRKREIAIKLNVIARNLSMLFDQAVEGDGLSRAKWSVIVAVARMPGATQRSIAAALEITEVSAGQLIDRLCADGYLERRAHPKDRRAHCVYLTHASRPLLSRLDEIARIHEDQTFAGLDEDDVKLLDELLDKIASNLAACRHRHLDDKKAAAARTEAARSEQA